MTKKFLSTVVVGSAIIATGISTMLLKHKTDSKKAIESAKEKIGSDKNFISSWSEPFYQKVNIDGKDRYCIVGGINVMENFEIIQYHFLADTLSGKLIDLKKTN
ncbi:hypothetical protein [Companilactobacillus sp. DQM5]|uniref:hypothetical protein n=1 Tax=Companilactobacillus sp. DQM5 TaxID=3463359 RepID=UPI004059DDE8